MASSLPGSSKNALDSVESAGDCMAAYLASDRQPAFSNNLFMVDMSEMGNSMKCSGSCSVKIEIRV